MWLFVSLLIGVGGAAVQWWVLSQLGITIGSTPQMSWVALGVPVVAALLGGAARMQPSAERIAPATPTEPVVPREPAEHTALRLLARLQEEGRLVDFLTEDVTPYSDAQIGAATRGIHASCAKVLREMVTLERVLPGTEDEEVTIAPGFDAGSIRLVGNVAGTPPFRGVLKHGGWRATRVEIPARSTVDPVVLAPAEVEIP
jgi:hypothetical protein